VAHLDVEAFVIRASLHSVASACFELNRPVILESAYKIGRIVLVVVLDAWNETIWAATTRITIDDVDLIIKPLRVEVSEANALLELGAMLEILEAHQSSTRTASGKRKANGELPKSHFKKQ
jgi:hypothetical protein